MAGHSKWAQIKRQKGVADQKRANVFTKLGRAISVAVKEGGGITDPGMNFRLRLAVEKAKEANMPKSNIDRAIDQGAGKNGSTVMESGMYEGYASGGVAVMVETVTDNNQRTYHDLRQIFDRSGGVLAQPGAVAYLFDEVGMINLRIQGNADVAMLAIMDLAHVVDVIEDEGALLVYTDPKELHGVVTHLRDSYDITESSLIMKPKAIMDADTQLMEKVHTLVENLEDNDDVQHIYTVLG